MVFGNVFLADQPVIIAIFCCLFLACSEEEKKRGGEEEVYTSEDYTLNAPDEVWKLPAALEEVSGMANLSIDYLLLNEDETGNIYLFNKEEGRVEKIWKWGGKGDYEGIALVGETAYLLESNGSLHKVLQFEEANPQLKKYQLPFKGEELEGLTYLEEERVLLLASKEGMEAGKRSIYFFSPDTKAFGKIPYLSLELAELEKYFTHSKFDLLSLELKKMLDPKGGLDILFPSGIAVHPFSQELYVLSAKSKLLVIYNRQGEVMKAVSLENPLFRQPEAIAFSSNGDLFIGNEGKGGKANILKFNFLGNKTTQKRIGTPD